MPAWDERFAPRESRTPDLTLIETCWRMTGPSRRVLDCTICRVETGVEVRCGYGPDDLLRSQLAPDVEAARDRRAVAAGRDPRRVDSARCYRSAATLECGNHCVAGPSPAGERQSVWSR